MTRNRSWGAVGLSIVLVSVGQLGMRWGMSRLPPPEHWPYAQLSKMALMVVALAVMAYVSSLMCWLVALRGLPLARAYSLLSLSYALVYLLAAWLPMFNEPVTLSKSLGVGLVMTGVWTVNSRRRAA
nr:4-amino-4-deoxy-L-arabinose-phosphoundecaprenol flippase subunit ArnF [uncultured Pseudomonas sp.]